VFYSCLYTKNKYMCILQNYFSTNDCGFLCVTRGLKGFINFITSLKITCTIKRCESSYSWPLIGVIWNACFYLGIPPVSVSYMWMFTILCSFMSQRVFFGHCVSFLNEPSRGKNLFGYCVKFIVYLMENTSHPLRSYFC